MLSSSPLSRRAKVYVACVLAAGAGAIVESLYTLHTSPVSYGWTVLALLTLFSGSFAIRVPSIPATVSVSEIFVVTAVLLFGTAPATLIVALDGLIISLWRRKWSAERILFNGAEPAVSIWIASKIFFLVSGAVPLSQAATPIGQLVLPLVLFTVVYFLFNSWLTAIAVWLETGMSAFKVWRQHFLWLSLNYFSGASVAILLAGNTSNVDYFALGLIIPLLMISYLTFKTALQRVEDARSHVTQLNRLYLSTIETFAMWIDAKDQSTAGHIRRVQDYAMSLAGELGVEEPNLLKAIEAAALLHDMGKLAVPEHILNKPGKLTPGEFEKMKLHASVGAQILSSIDFPYPVVPIVRHHHENWDGSGYPDRLVGTDIPIGARILAVVDCFDALTSDRPYRPRLRDDEALKMLSLRRGSMYDPLVVDAFLRVKSAETRLRGSSAATTNVAIEAAMQPLWASDGGVGGDREVRLNEERKRIVDLSGDTGKKLLHAARQAVPVSLALLFVPDDQSDTLVVAYAVGDGSEETGRLRLKVGQGVSGWVAANRRPIVNSDAFLDLGDHFCSDGVPLASCLSLPVLLADTLLGVLTLYSGEPNRFSLEHKELLESHVSEFLNDLGSRSQTIESGSGEHKIESGNSLNQVLVHGQMYGQRVALVVLQFSWHVVLSEAAVEDLIASINHVVRDGLRASDLTIRTSEGEVIVLLPQSDTRTAKGMADRISRSVEARTFVPPPGRQVHVAVHYGLATSPDDGSSLDALLHQARRSLVLVAEGPKNQQTVH